MAVTAPIEKQAVYRTATFRSAPLRLFLSDRHFVDLPWHAHEDLLIGLGFSAEDRRRCIVMLRTLDAEMRLIECNGEAVLLTPLAAGLAAIRSHTGHCGISAIDEWDFVDAIFDATLPMLDDIAPIERRFLLTSATDAALCDLSRQEYPRYCTPHWPRFGGGSA